MATNWSEERHRVFPSRRVEKAVYNIWGSIENRSEPLERYCQLDDCIAELQRCSGPDVFGETVDTFWIVRDDRELVCAFRRQPGGGLFLLTPDQIDLAECRNFGWNTPRESPLFARSSWI